MEHPLGDWQSSKQTFWVVENWLFSAERELISYPGSALWGASYLFYLWLELHSLL